MGGGWNSGHRVLGLTFLNLFPHLQIRAVIHPLTSLGCWNQNKVYKESESEVAQLCLPPCNPMDYRVHGILQARILEWVAFPFSRRCSQSRDQTQVSHIAGGFFTS